MAKTRETSSSKNFFKLIDRLAWEIRDLKQEMVQVNVPFDRTLTEARQQGLEGKPGGVPLPPPVPPRNFDFHFVHRHVSVVDRLTQTHPVWLLLDLGDEEAVRILQPRPPGAFVVRRSSKLLKKVLSLRLDDTSEKPVHDFPVMETRSTFSLEGSAMVFADLVRLVAFYCVSRDVLPFTLQLPQAIAVARTKDDLQAVAQLGAGFWDSALGDPGAPGTAADPSQEVCQTPAALCFLNPVFLQELQGDGASAAELHVKLPSHLLLQHSRMPEKVYWIHPAMETQAAVPTTAPSGSCTSPSGLKEQLTSRRSTKSQVVEEMLKCSQSKLLHSSCVEEAIKSAATPGLEFAVNQEGVCWQSDQRLSDVSMSTSSSDSLYSWPPQSKAFGDSTADEEEEEDEGGDVDEDEDEEEDYNYTTENNPQPVKAKKWPGVGPLLLPATLRAPLRRMSGALDSLVDPERRVVRQVQRLARDKTSFFGCLVQDYVNLVLEEHSCHMSSLDLLQTLRQFLTQTKAYLAQSAELEPPVRSLVREHRVDHVLEKAMHKCVLKPLRGALLRALQEFQEKRGEWQQLKANLAQAKTRTPRELGMDRAVAPDPLAIEKIRHKFHTMCKTYSPEKKVANLLEACKIIYAIMAGKSGGQHGADDFLPMLTYILAQCEMPQLDLEIQYMMELLDPLQLNGEGGYYLTSTYAAMCVIRNFEEEQAAEALSLQTDNTLRQWHRRRTTQHRAPAIEDLQAYLRVALQDPDSSCTAKTLQVRADCTAREVCRLCAHKFQVEDPESHALFLLSEGGARQLEPDSLPQLIKAEIHNRPQAPPFHFVYRRVTPAAHL